MNKYTPIKLNYKERKKYPNKRNPYKPYLKSNWNWKEIFKEIEDIKDNDRKFIKTVAIKYNITHVTLKKKYNMYCKNKKINFDKEYRGGHNKKFSEIEETEIFMYIKSNYIDKNRPLTNDIIKEIALNKLNHKNNNSETNLSNGWCTDFKKKWNLSTQKIRCSKIASNIPDNEEINIFLDKYDELSKHIKKSLYLIMMKRVIR